MADLKNTSKFLSLVLRHKPQTIGVTLDTNGWADVDALLAGLAKAGTPLCFSDLEEIVTTNEKKRFVFSEDKKRIRANQGHSIEVDLQLAEVDPPEFLYHGTAVKNIDSIKKQGLVKGSRNHVHLSIDEKTAKAVGSRHGKPVVLQVRAWQMHLNNHKFYRSENGVWLTDFVPLQYLLFP